MPNQNDNNPYHRTAELYEKKLRLPIIRNFRRAEESKLKAVFDSIIRPEDTVLEIGCGTGYYTRDLVRRAAHVIALDDSDTMLNIVKARLDEADLSHVDFVRSEGSQFVPQVPVDVVMHIGVLDYVKDWEKFITHSLIHAGRACIFTCPTSGLPGRIFHILARCERVNIQLYHQHQVESYFTRAHPDWTLEMAPVGLNSGWTGALTWVVTANRK